MPTNEGPQPDLPTIEVAAGRSLCYCTPMDNLAPEVAAELAPRVQLAGRLADRAGQILLRYLGNVPEVDTKLSAVDLVSAADRESEAYVGSELAKAFPADQLCLEEADGREGARQRRAEIEAAEFAWCVDPLDGTTNFVHGYPAFSVSIGILWRGRPVAGVVHAPAQGQTFAGGAGRPATRNDELIRCSSVAQLGDALLATGFPADRRQRVDALLVPVRRALLSTHGIRRSGAASLDLCDVACGRIDGYFEQGLSPWDTAASQAIVQAAGGRLSGYDGGPHDIFASNTVASNGPLHGELVALVQP